MGRLVLTLDEDRSTVLDADGGGTVTIGPDRMRQTWHVTSLSVSVATQDRSPTATVQAPSGAYLAGTYSGARDTTDLDLTLPYGSRLRVTWVGGDPGARASVAVTGTITVG
jgi:hypothetical protein